MTFWLQKEPGTILDIDVSILRNELKRQKFLMYSWQYLSMHDMIAQLDSREVGEYEEVIPVGSLDYVQIFLSLVHGVDHMNPIEVPDVLRQDRFLKRKYSIRKRDDLPQEGYYFVKDASILKGFTYIGEVESLMVLNPDDQREYLYQVSEVVDIISEYRCFVYHDKLMAINFYDGDCTVFPDISTIKSMIGNYMKDDARPRAYTIDVAVIRDRGTAIIEVHPWVSVGLYGYIFDNSLPYCYRDGFQYYIESNKEIKEWSNF